MKRFLAVVLTLCLVLGMGSVSAFASESDQWIISEAKMPTARHSMQACSIGDKIYTLGGTNQEGAVSTMEIYDTKNKIWSEGTPLPIKNKLFSIEAIGNKIYMIGGTNGSACFNSVWIYDVEGKAWTEGASMPTTKYYMSTSVVGNVIYVFGGQDSLNGPHSNAVWTYDVEKNTWDKAASMPTGKIALDTQVVNNKVYAIGGSIKTGAGATVTVNTVEVYDINSDTWENGTPLPKANSVVTSEVVGDKIYVIGGMSHSNVYSSVDIYLVLEDEWVSGPDINVARGRASSALVNGKLYVIGGAASNGSGANDASSLNTMESLGVEIEKEQQKLSILLSESETVQLSISYNLANNTNFAWSSSDEAVATVDANGKVTAVSVGETEITVQNEDATFKESIPVKVLEMADEQRLAVNLKAAEKAKLYLTEDPSTATWKSFDESVATVDATGQITGVAKGLAIVQANLEGETYQVYVRVNG